MNGTWEVGDWLGFISLVEAGFGVLSSLYNFA